MKVWTCNGFRGHYPVGTAAVIVADTPEMAAEGLNVVLERDGLKQDPPITAEDVKELPTDRKGVRILCDGNY